MGCIALRSGVTAARGFVVLFALSLAPLCAAGAQCRDLTGLEVPGASAIEWPAETNPANRQPCLRRKGRRHPSRSREGHASRRSEVRATSGLCGRGDASLPFTRAARGHRPVLSDARDSIRAACRPGSEERGTRPVHRRSVRGAVAVQRQNARYPHRRLGIGTRDCEGALVRLGGPSCRAGARGAPREDGQRIVVFDLSAGREVASLAYNPQASGRPSAAFIGDTRIALG